MRTLLRTAEEITPGRFPNVNLWMPWGGQGAPLWQDTTFATPAVANNDTVRQRMDSSDRRFDLAAIGDSFRPTVYRTTGERPSLYFNGSHRLEGQGLNTLNPLIFTNEAWAISGWVRPTLFSVGQMLFGRFISASFARRWMLSVSGASTTFSMTYSTDGTASASFFWSSTPTDNTWHRVTVRNSGDGTLGLRVGLDAEVTTSGTIITTVGAIPFTIGARRTSLAVPAGDGVNIPLTGYIGEMVGISGRGDFTAEEHALLQSRGPVI